MIRPAYDVQERAASLSEAAKHVDELRSHLADQQAQVNRTAADLMRWEDAVADSRRELSRALAAYDTVAL